MTSPSGPPRQVSGTAIVTKVVLTGGGALSLTLGLFLLWFTGGAGGQAAYALGSSLPPLLVGLAALLLARRIHAEIPPGLWLRGFGMAAKVGGVAFLAGFVGPMLFMPQSNQGPMLGLFITGPIGAGIGYLIGIAQAIHEAIVAEAAAKGSGA
jgi:hypothetical protein